MALGRLLSPFRLVHAHNVREFSGWVVDQERARRREHMFARLANKLFWKQRQQPGRAVFHGPRPLTSPLVPDLRIRPLPKNQARRNK